MIKLVEITKDKSAVCDRILRSLPDWFGIESSIVSYAKEAADLPMLAAVDSEDRALGFLTLLGHNAYNIEIHVMGVQAADRGGGLGKALIAAAESYARERGVRYPTVKTLSPARENLAYAQTRKFYAAVGFVPLEEFKTLWGEANPALLMIKSIC